MEDLKLRMKCKPFPACYALAHETKKSYHVTFYCYGMRMKSYLIKKEVCFNLVSAINSRSLSEMNRYYVEEAV